MKNCWEIKHCGREAGGDKVSELGECISSKEGFGHSCWAIAGTLCGGAVQGSVNEKHGNCLICEVYKSYNRMTGAMAGDIALQCPEEETRYREFLRRR
jgi:methyl-accepting chemotaxis protein